jgi:hypothetical protein
VKAVLFDFSGTLASLESGDHWYGGMDLDADVRAEHLRRRVTYALVGPGVGIGASSITRGLPNSRTTAAFMVLAMVHPRSEGGTGGPEAGHRPARLGAALRTDGSESDRRMADPEPAILDADQKKPSLFGL